MTAKPLKLGVVGGGNIFKLGYLKALKENDAFELHCVYDQAIGKTHSVFEEMAVRFCGSWDEFLAFEPECVVVSCPNAFHYEYTKKIIGIGIPVLCEKPLSTSLTQDAELFDLSRQKKTVLLVGYNNLYRKEVLKLKDSLPLIGNIKLVRMQWIRKNGIPGGRSWFTTKKYSGGGALIDIGSHLLSILNFFFTVREYEIENRELKYAKENNLDTWYSNKGIFPDVDFDVETGIYFEMKLNKKIKLEFEVDWNANVQSDKTFIGVYGDSGKLELNTLFGFSPNGIRPSHPLVLSRNGSDPISFEGESDPISTYRKQLLRFRECVAGNLTDEEHLKLTENTSRMIESLYSA